MFYVLAFEDEYTYNIVGCYDTEEEAKKVANSLDTESDIWAHIPKKS